VTEIGVRGFDIGEMNMIVSESLCLPLRRTKPLSEIILQKTDGIVIHIIEFIGRLTAERILRHSFVKGWEWDSDTIESCPISDSVAELFTYKLKSLSAADVLGLQICSIFGIRIEQRIISLLKGYDDSVDIGAALKAAIEVGLVESHGSLKIFRFSHDIIAQVRSLSTKIFFLLQSRSSYTSLPIQTDCFRFDSQRRTEAATEEARICANPKCNSCGRD
jgi:ATP-dependent RNA helicase DDX31/DBP7